MVGYEAAPGEFGLSLIRVEQTPMAADGSFELALPGLVIRLDQVDAIVLAFGMIEHLVHGARLVHRRGQGAFAHAAGARPPEFTYEHLLARKGGDHLRANSIDVGCRIPCGNRKVFPIGQNVDGDEIDRGGHVAVAQPEFPHVGIGDRHWDLRLDLANSPHEISRRHLPAQQDLVADDHRRNYVGKPVGQRNRSRDLLAAELGSVRQPQTLQHLHTAALGDFGNLVEPEIDRVGTHAGRNVLELG